MTKKALLVEQVEYLFLFCKGGRWQCLQKTEYFCSIGEISTSQLTNDEGMAEHGRLVQLIHEPRIPAPQMVYPDRGVNQDHHDGDRRRRTGRSFRSVPPSFASL